MLMSGPLCRAIGEWFVDPTDLRNPYANRYKKINL